MSGYVITLIRAMALLLALTIWLSSSAAAHDVSPGTYVIQLGAKGYVAQVFPTNVIDQHNGQLDPRWLASKLPETIAGYLLHSLTRDKVVPEGFTDYEVVDTGTTYEFHFTPDPSKAAEAMYYQEYYSLFMSSRIVGQGLNGANDCKAIGPGCWNTVGEMHKSYWRFYPPIGLPFSSQRTVMLTHYPPYRSMMAGDYLDNPTMARWNRILRSVGTDPNDFALYENTIDANPIAAPGAVQGSYYFPVLLASAFFDAPSASRGYVTNMIQLMTQPLWVRQANSNLPEAQRLTVPILVIGKQSRQFWANKFANQMKRDWAGVPELAPNVGGLVTLSPHAGAPKTPFMSANHPDVGLLIGSDACPAPGSNYPGGIWAIERSDLAVACYSYEMGKGSADPAQVAAQCDATWLTGTLSAANEAIVCTNGLMDASYEKGKCTWDEASAWCAEYANNLCGQKSNWPSCATERR